MMCNENAIAMKPIGDDRGGFALSAVRIGSQPSVRTRWRRPYTAGGKLRLKRRPAGKGRGHATHRVSRPLRNNVLNDVNGQKVKAHTRPRAGQKLLRTGSSESPNTPPSTGRGLCSRDR